MNRKEYYIKQIKASIFFSLNKERDSSTYLNEKNKLIENIYQYKLEENPDNENYGLEIIETFEDCIKYYNMEKGDFLHYYNVSFSTRKKRAIAKQELDNQSIGIHFSSQDKETIRILSQYLNTHPNISRDDFIKRIELYAKEFDIGIKKLKYGIQLFTSTATIFGDTQKSEDDETTYFDKLYDNVNIERELIEQYSIQEILQSCDEIYQAMQEKTKPLIALKLTAVLLQIDTEHPLFETLKERAFFSKEIYKEWEENKRKITNKEICLLLHTSESNLSQIWSRFLKKLKVRLEEKEIQM